MMITKKCIFDVLYTIANDKAFDIGFDNEKGEYTFPNAELYELHEILNDYSFEVLAYCCYILSRDGYIEMWTSTSDYGFSISKIGGVTFKGYELIEKLNDELKMDDRKHQA